MSQEKTAYCQLNLVGFTMDETQPLALFKDRSGDNTLPLWLAMEDLLAVTVELVANRLPGKGMGNDLLPALLQTLVMEVVAVRIDGTAVDGYSCHVQVRGNDNELAVPVTMPTALLSAVRFKVPVQVSRDALASSAVVDQRELTPQALDDAGRFLEMLESLSPEQMGKYPM
jgi:bifunctional DNase/RNase